VFLMSIGDLADKVDKAAHARVANAAEDDDATVAMLGKLAKTRTNTTHNDVNVESEENSFWNDLKHHDFYFNAGGNKGNPIAGRWARNLRGDAAATAAYDHLKGLDARGGMRPRGRARVTMHSDGGTETPTTRVFNTPPDEQKEPANGVIGRWKDSASGTTRRWNTRRSSSTSAGAWVQNDFFRKRRLRRRGSVRTRGRRQSLPRPRQRQKKTSPTRRTTRRLPSTTTASTSSLVRKSSAPRPGPRADPEGCPLLRETRL